MDFALLSLSLSLFSTCRLELLPGEEEEKEEEEGGEGEEEGCKCILST